MSTRFGRTCGTCSASSRRTNGAAWSSNSADGLSIIDPFRLIRGSEQGITALGITGRLVSSLDGAATLIGTYREHTCLGPLQSYGHRRACPCQSLRLLCRVLFSPVSRPGFGGFQLVAPDLFSPRAHARVSAATTPSGWPSIISSQKAQN